MCDGTGFAGVQGRRMDASTVKLCMQAQKKDNGNRDTVVYRHHRVALPIHGLMVD
jgi:hypothetical protein